MLVQPKGNFDPHERFHVPSGIGKALIATGVIEEYVAPAKPWEPVKWHAALGALQGLYPPSVVASCPNCGKNQNTDSQKGTADRATFTHCTGYHEECPADVSRDYQRLWQAWRKEFQPKLLAKEERERQIAATRGVTYLPTGRR